MSSLTIEPVGKTDQPGVVAMLVSAFIADPVERWPHIQKDPHWYLPWLGVDCARQGAGLGSELIEQCLVHVDPDHGLAFL